MPEYSNEAAVLEATFKLTETWKLQGKWRDARILLDGLHPVAARIDSQAEATVWLRLALVLIDEGMFGGKETLEASQTALERAQALARTADNPVLMGDIYDAIGFSIHASASSTSVVRALPDEPMPT